MISENFNNEEKEAIAKKIKPISINLVDIEMDKLITIGKNAHTMSCRSRIGNNIVDYFTFVHRLKTKGKYNINFFEFIVNIEEFKKKNFIQNMLNYYDTVKNKNKTKNEYIVMKEVYNICISAINIIRPLVYMEIYSKYNPASILDFCAGWGGAAVACAALNIPKYIGIEINDSLKQSYDKLIPYLKNKSHTEFDIIFENALNIDYTTLYYDLVFTSPPYYFIQKYENNIEYDSKKEMDEQFYKPIFLKTYKGLQKGGYYIINVCKEVYDNVLKHLFGEANEIYPYKKSKRQNDYNEIVYVWLKK
uniref:site-specific DNA-methyltransferase (cytosine-N(4)-specific) n=1 Tax=viral metagenome TaxID=1070528 RepID=A0A6C0ER06_9ZZZZ